VAAWSINGTDRTLRVGLSSRPSTYERRTSLLTAVARLRGACRVRCETELVG
jgi:hypothetical protein